MIAWKIVDFDPSAEIDFFEIKMGYRQLFFGFYMVASE